VDKDFITGFFVPMVDAPPSPQARCRVQSGDPGNPWLTNMPLYTPTHSPNNVDAPGFEGDQGYLYQNVPGNNGIDAEHSWTFE
jgi:hypothetical protein